MDVEDAIIASDFVECDKILGYHFDTFGYIEINHADPITRTRAAAVQPAGFVTKPYSARQLLEVVSTAGIHRK